jgi:hypothetical protein
MSNERETNFAVATAIERLDLGVGIVDNVCARMVRAVSADLHLGLVDTDRCRLVVNAFEDGTHLAR